MRQIVAFYERYQSTTSENTPHYYNRVITRAAFLSSPGLVHADFYGNPYEIQLVVNMLNTAILRVVS